MKRKICAGNWKMHLGPKEAREFLSEFLTSLFDLSVEKKLNSLDPHDKQNTQCDCDCDCDCEYDIVFFPMAVSLSEALSFVYEQMNSSFLVKQISFGAQNVFYEHSGAFTGEISPKIIANMGAKYALVGHSERRQFFGECDEVIAKKIVALQSVGITPMLCVGEVLEERQQGKTKEVILSQLRAALSGCDFNKNLVIAYEPVWAIGTGVVATPEQAEQAHQILRIGLKELEALNYQNIPILYGGSVKPNNCKDIAAQNNIDGFLVGGASLDPKGFAQIFSSLV